jgi:hypothetical protein
VSPRGRCNTHDRLQELAVARSRRDPSHKTKMTAGPGAGPQP